MYDKLIERLSKSFKRVPYIQTLSYVKENFHGEGWYVLELSDKGLNRRVEKTYYLMCIEEILYDENYHDKELFMFYRKLVDLEITSNLEVYNFAKLRTHSIKVSELQYMCWKFKKLDSKSLHMLKQLTNGRELCIKN